MRPDRAWWLATAVLLLVAGCRTVAPVPDPVHVSTPVPYLCLADETMIRSRPEADAPVVAVLELGDPVTAFPPGQDGWLEVTAGEVSGWCWDSDLVPEEGWGPLAYKRFTDEMALSHDLVRLALKVSRLFSPVYGSEHATRAGRDLLAEHERLADWSLSQLYPEVMDYFARSGYDPNLLCDPERITDPAARELAYSVIGAGYRIITAEGMLDVVSDPELLRALIPVVGEPLATSLGIRVLEGEQPTAADGFLLIPWDEVRRRATVLERLVRDWPDAPEALQIQASVDRYFFIYRHGIDNSPLFGHDGVMPSELRQSYARFLLEDRDSVHYPHIQEFYELCEREGFRLSPAIQSYLDLR